MIAFIFSAKQSVTGKDLPESAITLSRERERERERENRRDVFLGYLRSTREFQSPFHSCAKCLKTLSRRGINATAQLFITVSPYDPSVTRDFNHSNRFQFGKKGPRLCFVRKKEELTLKKKTEKSSLTNLILRVKSKVISIYFSHTVFSRRYDFYPSFSIPLSIYTHISLSLN